MPFTPSHPAPPREVPINQTFAGYLDISLGGERELKVVGTRNAAEEIASLRVTDQRSGTVVLELRLPLLEFALAMAARGMRPCEFEVIGGVHYVGLESQTATAFFWVPEGTEWRDGMHVLSPRVLDHPRLKADLAQWAVLGWRPRYSDMHNHHNSLGSRTMVDGVAGGWYRVHMYRHVEPGTPADQYPPVHLLNKAEALGTERPADRVRRGVTPRRRRTTPGGDPA